ncbi:putative serine esterase-domain-containing protein [Thelonectria olida]|uniref:Serine esterase-domain-containing protein n=1 Tax=Thelonectria olida TaxID=1576542 RepID=A0A9P9AUB5_9HYPO|nr:putative serine esterase-domain-containing protein [Thelonectria olida]
MPGDSPSTSTNTPSSSSHQTISASPAALDASDENRCAGHGGDVRKSRITSSHSSYCYSFALSKSPVLSPSPSPAASPCVSAPTPTASFASPPTSPEPLESTLADALRRADANMLLLHQVGSIKTGEVVRYTVTYTPSQDRILPSPEKLFLRVRNTCAIALRAAFVHGPYTLSVAAYPSHFDPNEKFENPERYGVPEFEPMVKAGGTWECELVVPDDIRQSAGMGSHGGFGKGPEHDEESATWIIEVASQVIFSTSAAVGYEVLLARDQKSLSLSNMSPVIGGQAQVAQPGKVSDYQQSIGAKDGHHPAQPRGIFSRAVHLKVEDTATLWNTPRLPGWDDHGTGRALRHHGADQPVESVVKTGDKETRQGPPPQKQKNIHLVILTHGLHSNLGADMLFMKESIDTAVRQAKLDAKKRRAKERASRGRRGETGTDPPNDEKDESISLEEEEDSEDEEVIVRGYSGNATKTEKGIKYLGKRLARYVLSTTYPDQPYLPTGKGATESILQTVRGDKNGDSDLKPAHKHSSIRADSKEHQESHQRPYKITSISFIAHSLGGPVQTYAIAYIQKHSPEFFDHIKPINFIAMASPFLGLSNENPLYVKFALDFGLVGRTGQDLGLTWRAPTIARSSWGAIVGNLGESAHKKVYGESQPESKPLLRILPTGPAHTALKKFRNRTVYSNVVNDGIVPLRTSCLLFLDWQGLGRVEKARRDAGLVETVVGFGWAELTGGNMSSPRQKQFGPGPGDRRNVSGGTTPQNAHEDMHEVPQPPITAMIEDDRASLRSVPTPFAEDAPSDSSESNNTGPLSNFFSFFKTEPKSESPPPPQKNPSNISNKQKMIFRKSQTINFDDLTTSSESVTPTSPRPSKVTTGHEDGGGLEAPPKTTFFESAGDLLNPKRPDVEYLLDPSSRPRTIFHDRVYHPSDIPAPPMKKRPSTLVRRKTPRTASSSQASFASGSSSPYIGVNHEDTLQSVKDYDDTANTNPEKDSNEVVDSSNIRVEEKISRAYHRDLSWRKVLVKLEPEAHNNIFVRRMFANAYGWPVVKHLVDTHFSDSATSQIRTDDQSSRERAKEIYQPPDEHGGETTKGSSQNDLAGDGGSATRTDSETREAMDKVSKLPPTPTSRSHHSDDGSRHKHSGERGDDSMTWSERDWADSECESDLDFGGELPPSERPAAQQDKGKEVNRSASPLSAGWNWAEKIVGKGRPKDEDLRY